MGNVKVVRSRVELQGGNPFHGLTCRTGDTGAIEATLRDDYGIIAIVTGLTARADCEHWAARHGADVMWT